MKKKQINRQAKRTAGAAVEKCVISVNNSTFVEQVSAITYIVNLPNVNVE